MKRTVGQVKWFDALRGWGYIKAEGNKDIFVHLAQIEEAQIAYFDVGMCVSFVIKQDSKGQDYAYALELC